MRWDGDHESRDVVDRRGEGGGGGDSSGLLYLALLLLRTRYGWIVVLLGLLYFGARSVLGVDDTQRVHDDGRTGVSVAQSPAEAQEVHFVSFVLDDVQATWEKILPPGEYRHAKLVLYTEGTRTGCGYGEAAMGPFYCPNDEDVYLDLGFFEELQDRLGARGQFAQAYVIAHELGHHVQKILGISQKVDALQRTRGEAGASVRLELQADCFAGIWAHTTAERQILEAGDVESALGGAAAVGDDRLQRAATGRVSPEKWTHGSSEERMRWFRRGYDAGTVDACDTFAASSL
jgi:hypothetical protein